MSKPRSILSPRKPRSPDSPDPRQTMLESQLDRHVKEFLEEKNSHLIATKRTRLIEFLTHHDGEIEPIHLSNSIRRIFLFPYDDPKTLDLHHRTLDTIWLEAKRHKKILTNDIESDIGTIIRQLERSLDTDLSNLLEKLNETSTPDSEKLNFLDAQRIEDMNAMRAGLTHALSAIHESSSKVHTPHEKLNILRGGFLKAFGLCYEINENEIEFERVQSLHRYRPGNPVTKKLFPAILEFNKLKQELLKREQKHEERQPQSGSIPRPGSRHGNEP